MFLLENLIVFFLFDANLASKDAQLSLEPPSLPPTPLKKNPQTIDLIWR